MRSGKSLLHERMFEVDFSMQELRRSASVPGDSFGTAIMLRSRAQLKVIQVMEIRNSNRIEHHCAFYDGAVHHKSKANSIAIQICRNEF